MIPSPWVGLVLALAAFRCTRLIGYDDFPPILRLRRWIVGTRSATAGSTNARMHVTNEKVEETTVHRWPTLSAFLWCPWCLGWWISLALYAAWRLEPSWTLTACSPFALSGVVGLVAKNLDP